MYSAVGRLSIPPARPLKASLLMAPYTVRGERMFCERLGFSSANLAMRRQPSA